MKASEKYRYYINSPIAYISYYFTEVIIRENLSPLEHFIKEIKTGKTPALSDGKYYESQDVSWFKPDEIGYDLYLYESKNKISNYSVTMKQATFYKKNTLLITCIGDIGRLGILKTDASSNQQITGILFKEDVLPEYMYYYLLCRKAILEKKSSSTTIPILNQKRLLDVKLCCPSKQVQFEFISFMQHCLECFEKGIVPQNFSFNLDSRLYEFAIKTFKLCYMQKELINEIESATNSVKHLRRSILQEAVQGKLVPQDPNDESAEVLLKRVSEEKERLIIEEKTKRERPLPQITEDEMPYALPVGWEWVRLGEIINGLPRNGYSPQPVDYTTKVKNLTLTATTSGVFKSSYHKYVDIDLDTDSYLWLKDGDILIQRSNSIDYVGTSCIYDAGDNNFIYPDLMMKIKVSKYFEIKYVHYVLSSQFIRDYYRTNATGTSKNMPKINQSIVINSKIPVPPLNEQRRIVEKVDQLMALCDELECNTKQSKSDADSLMQSVLQEAFKNKEEAC